MSAVFGPASIYSTSSNASSRVCFCASEENELPPRAVSGTSIISLGPAQHAGFSDEMPLNGMELTSSCLSECIPAKDGRAVLCCSETKAGSVSRLKKKNREKSSERGMKRRAVSSLRKKKNGRQTEISQNETEPFSLTPKELVDLNWGLGVHLSHECQKRYEKIRREKILAQRKSLESENWEARCFPR